MTKIFFEELHIPVAHIEAGARSYDIEMPEEINRRLTDHCSTARAFSTMSTLLSVFVHGDSAIELDIGSEKNI